jgi:hypothetical protein
MERTNLLLLLCEELPKNRRNLFPPLPKSQKNGTEIQDQVQQWPEEAEARSAREVRDEYTVITTHTALWF